MIEADPSATPMLAAVMREPARPLVLEHLLIDDPAPDEVLVRISAAGICHTDLAVRDGLIPLPPPIVLGHEGAGVVEKVGSGVDSVTVGDHVVLSFASCGHCAQCAAGSPAYCEEMALRNLASGRLDGTNAIRGDVGGFFFGQSSFATHAVVQHRGLVRVEGMEDLSLVAPLGCGLQTGAGAVLNRLRPDPGSSLAVFGTGAVGLAAIMAAAAATECEHIIGVDINPERLKLALSLGATHVIDARTSDLSGPLREIRPRGIDYTLDTTGHLTVMRAAVDCLAARGSAVLAGVSGRGTEFGVDPSWLIRRGCSVTGICEGDSNPATFIPRLIEMWHAGLFPLDRLVRTFPFAAINEACAAAESGEVVKAVLLMR